MTYIAPADATHVQSGDHKHLIHRYGDKRYADQTCGRCGGAGGWTGWPGFTCFRCGGTGVDPKMSRVLTPEEDELRRSRNDRRRQLKAERALADREINRRLAQEHLREYDLLLAWAITREPSTDDERTLRDMVDKLERFGSWSEKQLGFARTLVDRIENAATVEAQREAEYAAAADAPSGRIEVEGEILSTKWKENDFGGALKMLLKTTEGWKLWVTVPSSLQAFSTETGSRTVTAGDRVRLTATVEPSRDDPKFAFGKRPSKAHLIKE